MARTTASPIPEHVPPSAAHQPSKAANFALSGYEVAPGADGTFIIRRHHVDAGPLGEWAGFSNATDMLAWLTAGHNEVTKGREDGWF